MTTGRPNAAYAGQVVHFPDPLRAQRHPSGVKVDPAGHPDFAPYARAAAEVADPPDGFGVDELRLTDYVSANAALRAQGHELWADVESPVGTPVGWTWHHSVTPASPGNRRLELVPVEVKMLLRHHSGLAVSSADHGKRGTRPLQERRPVHFSLPGGPGGSGEGGAEGSGGESPAEAAAEQLSPAETEQRLQSVEESLGYTLPGPYRLFLKAAGGRAPKGLGLDTELGLLIDQPFFALRGERTLDDLAYVNKCLRDHVTKDYLGIGYAQGGLLVIKVRGDRMGTVWFLPHDDARDDGDPALTPAERCERLLLPCGEDFDAFLLRLAGSPPELQTVAELMVDGGFARAVPVEG
ncbi:hypothetical protein ABIA32_005071 [Streptacidiphilus sp. MAP12-20]|uniref:SMI1/KNR4 family protein n=1 Tax=Streptacidiphilus sp. MAP12-20 TaxID=3156299 RepID=UPI0035145F81